MADKEQDAFDLFMDREVILLAGGRADGKTDTTARLVKVLGKLKRHIVIIDRDRGLGKSLKEVGYSSSNRPKHMKYFLANTWDNINAGVEFAQKKLKARDWLVYEGSGAMWDFSQTDYSRVVYGENISDHLKMLAANAAKQIKELGVDMRMGTKEERKQARAIMAKNMQYSGLEGWTDWSVIKRQHNDDVFIRTILEGNYHILTTSHLKDLNDQEKEKKEWQDFTQLGARPAGEKDQHGRHDTTAILYREGDKFLWRTDLGSGKGKERGDRKKYRGVDHTGIGFIESYFKKHGLEL